MIVWLCDVVVLFFFKQKTAYELRISDWSADVCSSDLLVERALQVLRRLGIAPVAVLREGDELQVDPVLHRLAHFQKGLYGQEPVVADVDVAADGQRAARDRPAAEREGALLDQIGRASGRERVCQYA